MDESVKFSTVYIGESRESGGPREPWKRAHVSFTPRASVASPSSFPSLSSVVSPSVTAEDPGEEYVRHWLNTVKSYGIARNDEIEAAKKSIVHGPQKFSSLFARDKIGKCVENSTTPRIHQSP